MEKAVNRNLFAKSMVCLLVMYIVVIWQCAYLYHYIRWRELCFYYLPLLFTACACIFCTIDKKVLYIMSVLLLGACLTLWFKNTRHLTTENIVVLYCGCWFLFIALFFPLAELLLRGKKKIIGLIVACLLAGGGDVWWMYRQCISSFYLWMKYGGYVRVMLIACMVAVTIVSMLQDRQDSAEAYLVVITFGLIIMQFILMVISGSYYLHSRTFVVLAIEFCSYWLLLLSVLVDFAFDKPVRICYLCIAWLGMVGKELFFLWAKDVIYPYRKINRYYALTSETFLLLLFITVYTIWIKDRKKITFGNSVFWLISISMEFIYFMSWIVPH